MTDRDIGRRKVDAVASEIRRVSPQVAVDARATSVSDEQTRRALVGTDLVATCVDDGARWDIGALACLYLRSPLDLGTGVLGAGAGREGGADVRLIYPGRPHLRRRRDASRSGRGISPGNRGDRGRPPRQ